MSIFMIPSLIDFRISLDPELLKLLQQLADQQSDRQAAKTLSADIKAQADALSKVLPPSNTP